MDQRKDLLIRLLEHLESAVQLMDEHPAKADDADAIFTMVDTARETAEIELNHILLVQAGIVEA
jgi:hypothetical protein